MSGGSLLAGIARTMTPKVVFVLGAPGAGKGTQCQKIVDHFGYVHLSAGDLLREERARPQSKYGALIESYIVDGKIVPVEITCGLLQQAMRQSGRDRFLIDGFPRNWNNLDGWNKTVTDVELQFVLVFECPLEVALERCLKRGAAGSGRSDDNEESLKKRVQTFLNDSKPIIEHFAERDLVRKVDGTKPADEVFEEVRKLFQADGSGDS